MGQRTKPTRPGLPHTGRLHGRVLLASLKQSHTACHMGVSLLSPSLVQFEKGQF
ncbi:Bifunctional hldE [Gossypium arboreum]|uniref:Bifunctional hldE n=1 Tax=Gossypium arboreum TaxID=29729 RepID=A0A0B0MCM6_GOSAR|nr:Bifunctional hldE [Gossypium arboreum]